MCVSDTRTRVGFWKKASLSEVYTKEELNTTSCFPCCAANILNASPTCLGHMDLAVFDVGRKLYTLADVLSLYTTSYNNTVLTMMLNGDSMTHFMYASAYCDFRRMKRGEIEGTVKDFRLFGKFSVVLDGMRLIISRRFNGLLAVDASVVTKMCRRFPPLSRH